VLFLYSSLIHNLASSADLTIYC